MIIGRPSRWAGKAQEKTVPWHGDPQKHVSTIIALFFKELNRETHTVTLIHGATHYLRGSGPRGSYDELLYECLRFHATQACRTCMRHRERPAIRPVLRGTLE